MDDILTIVLQNTYSLSQLKTRLRVLKSNLLKTFFGGAQDLSGGTLSTTDLNWLQSLPPIFYQKFTKDNVYQIFTSLEKTILSLPVLTAYLTFEPDNISLSQLGAAARKNFFPNLLLDIKLDPNLIAGTALVWKGVYKDYSLKSKLEARKEEILQEFKKFLR